VGVQFEIDANGILAVLARDTATGAEQVVQMTSAVEVSDEAVEKMLEDALENAFDDMNARVFTEAKLKAQEMLPSVSKALAVAGDRLDDFERSRIEACVDEVKKSLEVEAAQQLKRAVANLDEATQTLAALVMEIAMQAAGPRRGGEGVGVRGF
jgi:molecular chaperone DnaK